MGEKRENKGEEIKGKKNKAEILPEVSSSSQSLLISFPWVGDPANKNKDLLPPPPSPPGPKVPILEVLGTKITGEGNDPGAPSLPPSFSAAVIPWFAIHWVRAWE